MIKKTFRLSEHAADCIKKIQCEKNLKTETAAIEFVLDRYCEQESLEAVLEKVIEEKIYPAMGCGGSLSSGVQKRCKKAPGNVCLSDRKGRYAPGGCIGGSKN